MQHPRVCQEALLAFMHRTKMGSFLLVACFAWGVWPLCVCLCVCVVCVAMMHIWRSEEKLWESRGSTQVVRLRSKHPDLLSPFVSPELSFGWTYSSSISDSSLWTMHILLGVFCVCTSFLLPLPFLPSTAPPHPSLPYSPSSFPYFCSFFTSFFLLLSPSPSLFYFPPSSI